MRIEVEPIPIAATGQERAQFLLIQQSNPAWRRPKSVAAALLTTLGLLLASACSSKNPDALTGLNVDENLAMMDANSSSNAAANMDASQPSGASAGAFNNRSDRSDNAPLATGKSRARSLNQELETNAIGTEPDEAPEPGETGESQVGNTDQVPNGG